jgi:hypothetical protein
LSKSKDANLPAPNSPAPKKGEAVDHELESIMSEIEEGLREDEFKKLWKRYGNWFIAAAVAVVIGVFGYQLWRQYDEKTRAELAGRYDAAVVTFEAGKYDDAIQQFNAVAAKKGEGYAALARLGAASAQLQKNDVDGALASYKALSEDKSIDPVYRDLGTILRVLHGMDREDPKVLETALNPILAPANPYYHSGLELAALLAAKQGDKERAAKLAEQITGDPGAPAGVRERAQDLASLYKPVPPEAGKPITTPAPAATPEKIPADTVKPEPQPK